MTYFQFLKQFKHLALFGLLLTLGTSFGQTYFVSLFVPYFRELFSLSNTTFGLMYSGATVCSAISLIWLGKWIDYTSLKNYLLVVFGIALTATVLLATVQFAVILFFGLYLLRLGFQGLLSHTSHTTMARFFTFNRGKALNIANLGFPMGEAVLPIFTAFLIGLIGWRLSWASVTIILLIFFIPVIFWLLRFIPADPREIHRQEGNMDDGSSEISWSRRMVLKDKLFYFILPAFIASPFLLTGLFLYQLNLAEFKGWTMHIMGLAFIFFAGGRIIFSLLGGPLIDTYTARKLFPFMLYPAATGLLVLGSFSSPATVFVYMGFLGATEGLASGIKSALWAEIYGIKTLGTVRSLMTFILILSTAFSPFIFGYTLDSGITFNQIAFASAIYIVIASLISMRLLKH